MSTNINQNLRWGVLCVFAGLAGIISPLQAEEQGQLPQQVRDWQNAAQACIDQNETSQAIAHLEKIVSSFPGTAYAMQAEARVARLYAKKKNTEQVRAAMSRLYTDYGDQQGILQAIFSVAEGYMYVGAYSEAIAICTEARSRFAWDPHSVLFKGWMGEIYAYQKAFPQAEQMAAELLSEKCDPGDFLDAMRAIGWGYRSASEPDRALAVYRQGLERYPGHSQAVYIQCRIIEMHLEKGDIQNALKAVEEMKNNFQTGADYAGQMERVARVLLEKGQPVAARGVCETFLEKSPADPLAVALQKYLVNVYIILGDMAQAGKELEVFWVKYKDREGFFNYAKGLQDQYQASNRPQESIALCRQMLTEFPKHKNAPLLYENLINAYLTIGDSSQAAAALEELFAKYSANPAFVKAGRAAASAFRRKGNPGKAIEIYGELMTMYPDSQQCILIQGSIAEAYLEMGAAEQACKAADELLAKYAGHPDFARLVNTLSGTFRKHKQYDKAIALQKYLSGLNPGLPIQLGCMAEIARTYVRSGDHGKVQNYVDLMLSQFRSDPNDLGGHLLAIGEEYYYAGQESGNKELFHKSVEVLNIALLQMCESNDEFAISHYVIGLSYRELGDYAKAANAFQIAYQADHDFQYADYCLFAVGYCYEKLLDQNLVSEAEDRAFIRPIYTQFLQIYPDNKGSPHVREWLKNNPE